MKADPERPEQIAERIVFEEWAYTVSQPAKLIETIVAAIHAERAQAARLTAGLEECGCRTCEMHERALDTMRAAAQQEVAAAAARIAAQEAEIATLTKERDLWRHEAKLQAGDRREP